MNQENQGYGVTPNVAPTQPTTGYGAPVAPTQPMQQSMQQPMGGFGTPMMQPQKAPGNNKNIIMIVAGVAVVAIIAIVCIVFMGGNDLTCTSKDGTETVGFDFKDGKVSAIKVSESQDLSEGWDTAVSIYGSEDEIWKTMEEGAKKAKEEAEKIDGIKYTYSINKSSKKVSYTIEIKSKEAAEKYGESEYLEIFDKTEDEIKEEAKDNDLTCK